MRKKVNYLRGKIVNFSKEVSNFFRFTGNENHDFNLKEAAEWTRLYRQLNPGEPFGHYFGKTAIQNILNQPGCVGIRIYNAIDPRTREKHFLVVGVEGSQTDLYNGLIAERCITCPTHCGNPSPLNS